MWSRDRRGRDLKTVQGDMVMLLLRWEGLCFYGQQMADHRRGSPIKYNLGESIMGAVDQRPQAGTGDTVDAQATSARLGGVVRVV